MNKINILLLDDQTRNLETLAELPKSFESISQVFLARTEEEFQKQFLDHRKIIDVVLIDLMLDTHLSVQGRPRKANELFSGFTLIGKLLEEYPGTRVVVLTQFFHETNIVECFRIGVKAFMLKHSTSLDDLVDGILRVSTGETIIPIDCDDMVLNKIKAYQEPAFAELDYVQIDILSLLVKGYNAEQIKTELCYKSRSIIYNKISRMMEVVGVSDRTKLIHLALSAGLTP